MRIWIGGVTGSGGPLPSFEEHADGGWLVGWTARPPNLTCQIISDYPS
jgi:hypothetical protein